MQAEVRPGPAPPIRHRVRRIRGRRTDLRGQAVGRAHPTGRRSALGGGGGWPESAATCGGVDRVGLLPDWGCVDALADGRLVRVLPSWEGESFPLSAVWLPGVAVLAKTRAFVDYLAVAIQGDFADASAKDGSRDPAG